MGQSLSHLLVIRFSLLRTAALSSRLMPFFKKRKRGRSNLERKAKEGQVKSRRLTVKTLQEGPTLHLKRFHHQFPERFGRPRIE
jgi:hypothetical protein